MQSAHSFFLGRRAIVRNPVTRPRAPAISWPADGVSQCILCLRLTCELSADNAGELVAAVAARVRAAATPRSSVVLDLSATTSALDPRAAAALRGLSDLLENDSQVRLWLVLPGAEARAAFAGDTAGKAAGPAVHSTFRAAILAAYALLPGAGLVTPELRELLARPPEALPLPGWAGFQGRLGA
jgi:anti-anti-sigma regulatory factor